MKLRLLSRRRKMDGRNDFWKKNNVKLIGSIFSIYVQKL